MITVNEWSHRSALERRYNGPIPPMAALADDHTALWAIQLKNRRHWAWADVRRIGKLAARTSHAMRETGDVRYYRQWQRLRRELAFALRVWRTYRDWSGDG